MRTSVFIPTEGVWPLSQQRLTVTGAAWAGLGSGAIFRIVALIRRHRSGIQARFLQIPVQKIFIDDLSVVVVFS